MENTTYLLQDQLRRKVVAAWLLNKRNKNKKNRSCAVRQIFKNRKQQGAYHNLVQEIRLNDVDKYFNFVRMMPEDFDILLGKVKPHLQKLYHSTEPISPSEMLTATLRYLASGDSMVSISYLFRLGKSTVSEIIRTVCYYIWQVLKDEYLIQPTQEIWLNVARGFNETWNIPNCIGAIDGKHVVMQSPSNSASDFYNYKHEFSIVLMAVCDAEYRFTIVDIGAKGRQSDGGIFRNSILGQMLFSNSLNLPEEKQIVEGGEPLPYFMVADEAFPLSKNIMRPYGGRFLIQDQRVFNYRLSRARRIIENTFGILAARWRIFRRPILAKLDTVEVIVQASVCLHNFLRGRDVNKEDRRRYCPNNFVDREDQAGIIVEGDWRKESLNNLERIRQVGGNAYSKNAAQVREVLKEYFMFECPIEPQWFK